MPKATTPRRHGVPVFEPSTLGSQGKAPPLGHSFGGKLAVLGSLSMLTIRTAASQAVPSVQSGFAFPRILLRILLQLQRPLAMASQKKMETRARLKAAAALASFEPSEVPPTPEQVADQCSSWGIRAQLKPHQAQGVSWLIRCYLRGFNVILGDEMGLGKTLQAITLISYLKFKRSISGPFLILCPLSVVDGWSNELSQFAPMLRVIEYIGGKDKRTLLSKEICQFVIDKPSSSWENPALPFDVLLTTYDLAIADETFLSQFHWRYVIIDEAQRLKNPSSVLYKTLESNYMIPRRLLMTGTPIQNNLVELWALLHFCMPRIFDNLEDFISIFPFTASHDTNKEAEDLKLLKDIMNVFMIRRTKLALVESKTLDLPPLSEITIFARLVPLQRNIYLSILKKELPKLVQTRAGISLISMRNIVVQLRKACSHPYLFDGVEPEPFEEGEHLIQSSGKMIVLDALLKKLYSEKHRVLIYAQMTRTLDILQDYLEFRGYLYERLDGSVRAEERFASARKFNARTMIAKEERDSATPFVFLLTTRAGGVGLNLTAADTVIFYEQDWNPQADRQAVQRAHRIGQVNPVLSINLVAESTIDEVILSRARKKLKLTNDIIGKPNFDLHSDEIDDVKSSDLQSMIIFGLEKLHSSLDNRSERLEETPDMSKLVQEALEQRFQQNPASDVNFLSSDYLEENLYTFEGQDFSSRKKKFSDESECTTVADHAVLNSWIVKLQASSEGVESQNGRMHLDGELVSDDYRAAKQRKTEEKKMAKWEILGYKSLAVKDPGKNVGEMITDTDGSNVHFVFGDCTRPLHDTCESSIIFSAIDNSGTWGSGGMFSALDRLSSCVQKVYEAAHAAGDLHMGDLHLIPLDVDEHEKQAENQGLQKHFVGLGVVQSYNSRREIPRSDISVPALESCLRKVTKSAAAVSASIHMPRISSRPGQDRKEWYVIERLLRKHAAINGVHIYVYYYKRSDMEE